MTPGSATDYMERQLLAAMFGFTFTAPSAWWLHLSTTPVSDDGTGVTEFSGNGYAAVQIPGWNPTDLGFPAGGVYNGINATQTGGSVIFPQPTGVWWADFSRHIYPYLTDASSGGTVFWSWDDGPAHGPKPDHPLVYPTVSITSLGTVTGNPVVSSGQGKVPGTMVKGAIDSITGAASYTPPGTLYVSLGGLGVGSGFGVEPWDRVSTGLFTFDYGDPNYARKTLALTTPATVGGVTSCSNSADLIWTVSADNANYTHGNHWTGSELPIIWDAAGDGGWTDPANAAPNESLDGNAILAFSGSYSVPAVGDQIKIPAGALIFELR